MSEQIIYTTVIVLILFILYSLGTALFCLVKDKSDSKRTVKALTIRIALSITLFALLMLSFMMGWIKPHGIMPS